MGRQHGDGERRNISVNEAFCEGFIIANHLPRSPRVRASCFKKGGGIVYFNCDMDHLILTKTCFFFNQSIRRKTTGTSAKI